MGCDTLHLSSMNFTHRITASYYRLCRYKTKHANNNHHRYLDSKFKGYHPTVTRKYVFQNW